MIERIATKIFGDGADLDAILHLAEDPRIDGFTTNPTLMREAGVEDYEAFARELVDRVTTHPISLEVFADEPGEICAQAREIASWGENVYVKIPVTTTAGQPLTEVARELSEDGVRVNVTAVFTPTQIEEVATALADGAPSYISVFAGRIADAGIDPMPIMRHAVETIEQAAPRAELIWASPREILNLVQADQIGCHIITMTHDLLAKLDTLGRDLEQFSLDTVRMFHGDARAAAYEIRTKTLT